MNRTYYIKGFRNHDAEAVFTCFANGLHIITGSTKSFVEKALRGDIDVPFTLETKEGDLAVGGVDKKTRDFVKNYILNTVMSRVRRNHIDGNRCSIVPILSCTENRNLLTVSAFIDGGEIKNSENDYARLEAYVKEWLNGIPGMFV